MTDHGDVRSITCRGATKSEKVACTGSRNTSVGLGPLQELFDRGLQPYSSKQRSASEWSSSKDAAVAEADYYHSRGAEVRHQISYEQQKSRSAQYQTENKEYIKYSELMYRQAYNAQPMYDPKNHYYSTSMNDCMPTGNDLSFGFGFGDGDRVQHEDNSNQNQSAEFYRSSYLQTYEQLADQFQ